MKKNTPKQVLRSIPLLALLTFFPLLSPASDNESFSILTWNIWFDNSTGKERYPLILDQLYHHNADIVLLQEVTAQFVNLLKAHKLRSRYHVTFTSLDGHYQNITLTQQEPENIEAINLQSEVGRKALLIELKRAGYCSLTVANVHLESPLGSTDLRIKQLDLVNQKIPANRAAIIAGDFNFGNESNEEKQFPKNFSDSAPVAWRTIPTYDVDRNPWAEQTKYWFEASRRLDRIYTRGINLHNPKYTLVGNESSEEGQFLSDHYGVKLTFELNRADKVADCP